jgi:hypothetical protein
MDPHPTMNPYAPPKAPITPVGRDPSASARIEGRALVLANGATLPPVCLKCGGAEAIEWREQRFKHVPPWARLLGVLFQELLAKRSRFRLPLCSRCHEQWRKWNRIVWLVWMPGIVLTLLGVASLSAAPGDFGLYVLLVGLALAGAGLVGGIVALVLRQKRIVYAARVNDSHSWLHGVHESAMQAIVAESRGI